MGRTFLARLPRRDHSANHPAAHHLCRLARIHRPAGEDDHHDFGLGGGAELAVEGAEGGGVLVTPWGHGTWGIVASRPRDVLVAEFAQKRHMLRFEESGRCFVSTRCDDGEVVRGCQV